MGEPGEAGREHQDVVLTWELQAAMNHHMRDLGTKVGSSERAAITLIHQTISIGLRKRILMRNYLYQVGLWVSLTIRTIPHRLTPIAPCGQHSSLGRVSRRVQERGELDEY